MYNSYNDSEAILTSLICTLPFTIAILAAYWRIFTKAGRPGWASIVPIYNVVVMLDIAGKPWWWLFLFFIPFVNIFAFFVFYIDLAKAFGQDTLFGCGLIFLSPIFFLILAFSGIEYVGAGAYAGKAKNDLFYDEKPKNQYFN
jgi:hypothetical protein